MLLIVLAKFLKNVARCFDQLGAFPDQRVAAPGQRVVDGSRDGEDFPVLFQGQTRRDQRTALPGRFDDQQTNAQAADDPIAPGKVAGFGRRARWKFGNDRAVFDDFQRQLLVSGGINSVQAGSGYGNGQATAAQCADVACRIDTQRQAAGNDETASGQRTGKVLRGLFALAGRVAAADDGDLGAGSAGQSSP